MNDNLLCDVCTLGHKHAAYTVKIVQVFSQNVSSRQRPETYPLVSTGGVLLQLATLGPQLRELF